MILRQPTKRPHRRQIPPILRHRAFKLSFMKDVTDFTSALDIVVNPAKYRLWKKLVERIVRKLVEVKTRKLVLIRRIIGL